MSNVKSYQIMSKIKLVRRILDHGFQKALEYADFGEDEQYTKTLEAKSKEELRNIIKELKEELNSNSVRNQNKDLKFCIGKCQREFIPKDGNIEIYCPSCDRTIAVRPIKNDFKDI
jgi:NADH pyrophosphatase NudC (nudix superfamily)